MMISNLHQLRASTVLKKMADLTEATEESNFFPLAYYKDQQRRRKRELFSRNGIEKIVVVTNPNNYINVSSVIKGTSVTTITDVKFAELAASESECRRYTDGAVIILNNNNVAKIIPDRMAAIVDHSVNALFVIHDYDNHHWHEQSLQCALLADVYAPAHVENFAVAGRINPTIIAGIPCGSIQWRKSFLIEHLSDLVSGDREPEPLGMHSYYGRFRYRNSVLATVNKRYQKVGLLQKDFHGRTALDRWNEWISYPVHWIAPVFNDLPLRFFDALITGGIPLVPSSLKPYLNLLGIPSEFYICYTPYDLVDVEGFVNNAVAAFEIRAIHSRVTRHTFALENFHVDEIIYKLWKSAEAEFVAYADVHAVLTNTNRG